MSEIQENDLNDAVAAAEGGVLPGQGVFPGIAYGVCQIFSTGEFDIPQFTLEKRRVRGEVARLRKAVSATDEELRAISASLDDVPAEARNVIEISIAILNDPTLLEPTIDIIREKLINAEWALSTRLEKMRLEFEAIEDDYIRERFRDIAHVVSRIQRHLTGSRNPARKIGLEYDEKIILVSDVLDPADILQIRLRNDLDIVGLVLEDGSATSHTAILASGLEIPTLVGVAHARELLVDGSEVLLDADRELVNPNPDEELRRGARQRMREALETKRRLKRLKGTEALTLDGTRVELLSNIVLPEDTRDVHAVGSAGVGLFRTEYLYLNRDTLPDEEEQYQAYSRVARSMKEKVLYIRTADLGGDKSLSREAHLLLEDHVPEEFNPSMGLRGLRFSIAFPSLFKTQVRAVLRASNFNNVRILLPFITFPTEVIEAKRLIEEVKDEMRAEGLRFDEAIPVGGMIEVPGTVMILKELIPLLDFFSLGTNDLIQYTLAVDRTNASVAGYYEEYHPGVLRLIAKCMKGLCEAGKPVSVCGEMAGHPDLLAFFLGLGCTTLSMTPSQIPLIKERVLRLDIGEARVFANRVLRRRSLESLRQLFSQQESLLNDIKESKES